MHWTGLNNLEERISETSQELQSFYYEHYPRLSWYVHSGSTGYGGVDEKALRNSFLFSHVLAQDLFGKITIMVSNEIKITKAIPWLTKTIGESRYMPVLLALTSGNTESE